MKRIIVILPLIAAILLAGCGSGGYTEPAPKPDYPKAFAVTGHAVFSAAAFNPGAFVTAAIDRKPEFYAVNYEITLAGYDALGALLFSESVRGQIKEPYSSIPVLKIPAPAGLTRLAILEFKTKGF